MSRYYISLLFLSMMIMLSCSKLVSKSPISINEVNSESKEKIKIGESLSFKSTNISFSEVLSDSRCPKNAECLHQGFVLIKLIIDEEAYEIKFKKGEVNLLNLKEYSIQILDLYPKPDIENTLNKEDYIIALKLNSTVIKESN